MDEYVSTSTPRHEVRGSIDEHLDTHGAELVARLVGRDPKRASREAVVDNPANEQGAKALMALAGGRRT